MRLAGEGCVIVVAQEPRPEDAPSVHRAVASEETPVRHAGREAHRLLTHSLFDVSVRKGLLSLLLLFHWPASPVSMSSFNGAVEWNPPMCSEGEENRNVGEHC